MVTRSTELFPLQRLVLLCYGAPVAIGRQWAGLPFCLCEDSGLAQPERPAVCLSWALCDQSSGTSAGVIVARATLCLPCSDGAAELTG